MTYETLQQAYAAACKERDEYKAGYDALAKDLKFRVAQARELQAELNQLKQKGAKNG